MRALPAQAATYPVREALARWLTQAWRAGCRLLTEALEAQAASGPMAWDGPQPMRAVMVAPRPSRRTSPHHGAMTSPLVRFGRYASLPCWEIEQAEAAELVCPICFEPAEGLRRPVAVVHPGGIHVYEHQELIEDWRRSRLHWTVTPDKLPLQTLYRLVIRPSGSVGTQRPGGGDDVLGLRQDGALEIGMVAHEGIEGGHALHGRIEV